MKMRRIDQPPFYNRDPTGDGEKWGSGEGLTRNKTELGKQRGEHLVKQRCDNC